MKRKGFDFIYINNRLHFMQNKIRHRRQSVPSTVFWNIWYRFLVVLISYWSAHTRLYLSLIVKDIKIHFKSKTKQFMFPKTICYMMILKLLFHLTGKRFVVFIMLCKVTKSWSNCFYNTYVCMHNQLCTSACLYIKACSVTKKLRLICWDNT